MLTPKLNCRRGPSISPWRTTSFNNSPKLCKSDKHSTLSSKSANSAELVKGQGLSTSKNAQSNRQMKAFEESIQYPLGINLNLMNRLTPRESNRVSSKLARLLRITNLKRLPVPQLQFPTYEVIQTEPNYNYFKADCKTTRMLTSRRQKDRTHALNGRIGVKTKQLEWDLGLKSQKKQLENGLRF